MLNYITDTGWSMVFCPVPTVIFNQVSLSLLHPKNKTKPKKGGKGSGEVGEGGGERGQNKKHLKSPFSGIAGDNLRSHMCDLFN